ncbi:hypothetical protein, conserved [Eimeria maxima]|uniref:Uncharacterized protein n=1 Tax=Eimeria maxima TaxID=5804 RepID=U6MGW4_EIMMA|nr:hypothetical protein, conserved [Eimeria maxima]CDJ61689.1 hypothetical protein, conserved [Eimeria maxima]
MQAAVLSTLQRDILGLGGAGENGVGAAVERVWGVNAAIYLNIKTFFPLDFLKYRFVQILLPPVMGNLLESECLPQDAICVCLRPPEEAEERLSEVTPAVVELGYQPATEAAKAATRPRSRSSSSDGSAGRVGGNGSRSSSSSSNGSSGSKSSGGSSNSSEAAAMEGRRPKMAAPKREQRPGEAEAAAAAEESAAASASSSEIASADLPVPPAAAAAAAARDTGEGAASESPTPLSSSGSSAPEPAATAAAARVAAAKVPAARAPAAPRWIVGSFRPPVHINVLHQLEREAREAQHELLLSLFHQWDPEGNGLGLDSMQLPVAFLTAWTSCKDPRRAEDL